MIYDSIAHAQQYQGLHAGIDQVLEEVQKYTSENYPKEASHLNGNDVYMMFGCYETHPKEEAIAEAHQQYIDVMYMVEGEELIYVKHTDDLQNITKEYNPEIDALLGELDEDAMPILLKAGSFVVLFPQDAHSPACVVDSPMAVKKIVGKVRI